MKRHPLDGNAIAADAYYGQDRAEDYHQCAVCHEHFDDTPQDPVQFTLCTGCADAVGDEK